MHLQCQLHKTPAQSWPDKDLGCDFRGGASGVNGSTFHHDLHIVQLSETETCVPLIHGLLEGEGEGA